MSGLAMVNTEFIFKQYRLRSAILPTKARFADQNRSEQDHTKVIEHPPDTSQHPAYWLLVKYWLLILVIFHKIVLPGLNHVNFYAMSSNRRHVLVIWLFFPHKYSTIVIKYFLILLSDYYWSDPQTLLLFNFQDYSYSWSIDPYA